MLGFLFPCDVNKTVFASDSENYFQNMSVGFVILSKYVVKKIYNFIEKVPGTFELSGTEPEICTFLRTLSCFSSAAPGRTDLGPGST